MWSIRTIREFSWWRDFANREDYSYEDYIRGLDGSFGVCTHIHYAPIAGSRRYSRVSVSRHINQQLSLPAAGSGQLRWHGTLRVSTRCRDLNRYMLLGRAQRYYRAYLLWIGSRAFISNRVEPIMAASVMACRWYAKG